jgi:uncharacterized protein (TIGR03663 family)
MAESVIGGQTERAPLLDRTISLTSVSWRTVAWIGVLLVAVGLRLPQLGLHTLSQTEAQLADAGYRLFQGNTTGPGNEISNVGPVPVLMEGLAIFLFGASDTAARIMPALLGISMVAVLLGMRAQIGRGRTLAAATLLALSPTAVYLSRIADPESFVAAFTLVAVVAFIRLGAAEPDDRAAHRRLAVTLGVALALMYGSGPSSLSVLLAIVISIAATTLIYSRSAGALRASIGALAGSTDTLIFFAGGLAITLVTVFSRFFTDFSALAGLGQTIVDWGKLLSTATSSTPTQFFLLAILLYEILALYFAAVSAFRSSSREGGTLPGSFFAIWFAVALIVFSFSSGSLPVHAIHVALPLLILGGYGLGDLVTDLDPKQLLTGKSGLLLLLLVGLIISVFSLLIMLGRIDTASDQRQAVVQAFAALIIAVFPLGFGCYLVASDEQKRAGFGTVLSIGLLAISVFLAGYTLRTTIQLSFFNADGSTEMLAQQTSTPAIKQIVRRVTNLSRDFTLTDGSARDPEGGHGLTIAIDQDVQWPFRWYFRDFPDATIVASGQAPLSGSQIVIAPDNTGMAESGYSPQEVPAFNRVPSGYAAPDFGEVLKSVFFPSRWESSVKFLLFREGLNTPDPETVSLGLAPELANAVTPNNGPFALFDQAGAGSGNGQFNQPRGIAVSPDGEQIYVVDMGNARVEHFDATGQFINSVGGQDNSDVAFGTANGGLGPTGIAVSPDGLVYVADTWNHRVVVLDESGHMVREFGQFGDTQDSPDAAELTGSFFGPRAIAVYNNEIYVVDTGNERVQVFGLDGTFVRSWGGNGTGPTQFVEPVGIAIDANGKVYVADSGNGRISVFTDAGSPVVQWPVAAWQGNLYFEPYLAFDDDGFLYASSSATGSVEVLDPNDGQLVTEIHEVGSTRLQEPTGLAWSPEGDLLITDKGRSAVFQLTPGTLPDTSQSGGDEIGNEASPVSPEPAVEPEDEASPDVKSLPASPASSPVASPAPSPAGSPGASPMASPVASPIASPAGSPRANG